MVHNSVPLLEDLCLGSLESLVSRFSLHTAKQIIKQVPDMGEECDDLPGIGKEVVQCSVSLQNHKVDIL